MATSKFNIVMIIVDALRPKDLSLYGYLKEVDKNIKRIASESIVFENNFTASNLSDPSRTSIFSGQYPFTHGLIHQYPNIRKKEVDKLRKLKFWLPIYLKNLGYSTIAATPLYMWLKKGFDYVKEEEKASGYKKFYKKIISNDKVLKILLKFPSILYRFGKKIFGGFYNTNYESSKKTIDFVIQKINGEKKPFFLFIHFEDTHYPYPGAKTPRKKGNTTIKDVIKKISLKSQREYVKKRFFDASATTLEQMREKLNNAIINVDKQIGRLYDFLNDKKLLENTIVIILADHGTNFGEHNIYFEHSGLYDEAIHVPLIMKIPGFKHKRIDSLTQSIDIAPTILDILEEKEKNIDGISLISLMRTGGNFRNRIITVDGTSEKAFTIRTKKRKLIISDSNGCSLCGAPHNKKFEEYDLEKDPGERNNIYNGRSQLEEFSKNINF